MSIRSALRATGFDRPLRALRYAYHPPQWYQQERNEVAFYKRFLRAGSLCFDVGANVGTKTEYFRRIGAHVVAVEPLPGALAELERRFADDSKVTIVGKAVGASRGAAELHVGDTTTISTLSDRWLAVAKGTERLRDREWPSTVTVPVVTLEDLVREFGLPAFCKIDVEGYELEVAEGLATALPALSFEYQPEAVEDACAVIERLARLGPYSFNYSFAAPLRLEMPEWLGAAAMQRAMATVCRENANVWGDVYAVAG